MPFDEWLEFIPEEDRATLGLIDAWNARDAEISELRTAKDSAYKQAWLNGEALRDARTRITELEAELVRLHTIIGF